MQEFLDIVGNFSGITTWIGLAGLGLFVFLLLFRTVATDLVTNLNVPRNRAAGIVNLFMILVALVVLVTITLAFLDARAARAAQVRAEANAAYEIALSAQQEQVRSCVADRVTQANFTQPFSAPGGVRCPGGGCLFKSGSCNRREGWVSYVAPGGYFIENYELTPGDMNGGSVGNTEVHQRDQQNRTTGVRAFLLCDPRDDPGAPGGWANATITGTIRLADEPGRREEFQLACVAEFPPPTQPKS